MTDKLDQLKKFDTPTISNVVATYPEKDYCLGLYDPWNGSWYTDETIKCFTPSVGVTVGYAVTCTYGLPDPNFTSLKFKDVLKAVKEVKGPTILVVKQEFPEEIKKRNGLLGGNMMTALKSLGTVGVISDGPSRDIDEIKELGMNYLLTGLATGHGKFAIRSVNSPVRVGGMNVASGDAIHMDRNGALKFPAKYVDFIAEKAEELLKIENDRQEKMLATKDVNEIAKIMSGFYD